MAIKSGKYRLISISTDHIICRTYNASAARSLILWALNRTVTHKQMPFLAVQNAFLCMTTCSITSANFMVLHYALIIIEAVSREKGGAEGIIV